MRLRDLSLWTGLVLVLWFFAAPLLRNLGEPELTGDETIYAYAVERILDTGEWATPRSIPGDGPFLEKPPLKMWLVAGGMKLGILPRNAVGMRLLDAVFGAIAFVYVYLLGWRLGGIVCGAVGVLVLFTLDPLIFGHGLRSNNMEASVFLCYCAGVYHFVRWVEADRRQAARWHAVGVALAFVLGFMTKDVAAFFLPLIGATALALRKDGLARLRSHWHDWIVPVALVLILSVPWFAYETLDSGWDFWQILIGQHVVERFTASLDPAHLHPWSFYATTTWVELGRSGTQMLVTAGFAALSVAAWLRRSWLAQVIWIWGVVPVVLLSFTTSKLTHYVFPFWPPLGLGAGLLTAWVTSALVGPASTWLGARLPLLLPRGLGAWIDRGHRRQVLTGLAILALLLAVWTATVGPVRLMAGRVTVFRNSSVVRPLAVATVLAWVSGHARQMLQVVGLVLVALALPLGIYVAKVEKTREIYHPLRATRDCVQQIEASASTERGVLRVARETVRHDYYYYLWRLGPYDARAEAPVGEVLERLLDEGRQTPVVLGRAEYDVLVEGSGAAELASARDRDRLHATLLLDGFTTFDDVAVLLPGPFRDCAPLALAAGGKPLWGVAPHRP